MSEITLNSSEPYYIQIKEKIKEAIKSGEYSAGEKIPSERELCELFDVSRITVRQAVQEGVNEGFLYTVHGKGTFVKEQEEKAIKQNLTEFCTFQNTIISKGLTPGTRILEKKIINNTLALSRVLDLSMDKSVYNLKLLGTADGEPYSFYDSYFDNNLGKEIFELCEEMKKNKEAFTTLDIYKKIPRVKPVTVEQIFEAKSADEKKSNLLDIEIGAPIFLVTSIIYDENDIPLEYREAYYRSDEYKFYITRPINIC